MKSLTVLYDFNCGLCQRARRWLEAEPKFLTLEFIPAGSDHARYRFPTLPDKVEELVVVAAELLLQGDVGDEAAGARELRHQPTPAEEILWQALRAGRLAGLKFRRQHPYGPFVLDFLFDEDSGSFPPAPSTTNNTARITTAAKVRKTMIAVKRNARGKL